MRRSALVTALACPLILGLTACASGTGSTDAASAAPTATLSPTAEETVEFEYEGDRGPESWSTLSADFAQCANSTTQSPIDLTGASAGSLPDPEFQYTAGAVELTNTTHTVLATEGTGSTLELDGHTADLVQFHMHEPSEHTVNGVRYDAEVHLVHTDDTGAITVVAILFAAGAENPALAPYIDALPDGAGSTTDLTEFDPSALLPAGSSTFRYTGSLTTPPCTEGVTWVVLEQPAEISSSQLTAFRSVIEQNDRPVQDLGSRTLTLDAADS